MSKNKAKDDQPTKYIISKDSNSNNDSNLESETNIGNRKMKLINDDNDKIQNERKKNKKRSIKESEVENEDENGDEDGDIDEDDPDDLDESNHKGNMEEINVKKEVKNNIVMVSEAEANDNARQNIIKQDEIIKHKANSNEDEHDEHEPISEEVLQSVEYFDFLFYSMKVELKSKEFFGIVENGVYAEIVLWIIGCSMFFTNNIQSPYIWLHLLHLLRSSFGIYIQVKLPKSYNIIQEVDDSSNSDLEFQPIVKNFYQFKKYSLEFLEDLLSTHRGILLLYFSVTFINFFIDVFDFFFNLEIYQEGKTTKEIVVIGTYELVAILYIGNNLIYYIKFLILSHRSSVYILGIFLKVYLS